MKRLLILQLFPLLLLAGGAYADCSIPAGTAGDVVYASNFSTMAYCNGSNWISMAGGVSQTVNIGGSSTNPAGSDTYIQYNSSGSFGGSSAFTYSSGLLTLTGTISATNLYAASVSGSTGTFGSIGAGAIAMTGNLTGSPLISTSNGGVVSATYGYFKYISATSGLGGGSMATLTDVSETGVASGMLLRYNGTKWESVGASTALSTTTMLPNWPDAIACNVTSPSYGYVIFRPFLMPYSGDGKYYYTNPTNAVNNNVLFNADGSYSSTTLTTIDCNVSIPTLYARGQAFNFIGGQYGGSANQIIFHNGTQGVGNNNLQWISGTAVVSVTGTISATNISVTSLQPGSGGTCSMGTVGMLRRNPETNKLQICQDH